MEFNEKLQELRKQKNLTQEQLAEQLYVSRTAISKWESGKGYPSIDSLKEISKFFSVSIDELLSGEELISACQEDNKRKEQHMRDKVFGILDLGTILLFVLPVFGQKAAYGVNAVSLMNFVSYGVYMRNIYIICVISLVVIGAITLLLQSCSKNVWISIKAKISIAINTVAVLIFIGSLQPYASLFLFLMLALKVMMLIKWN